MKFSSVILVSFLLAVTVLQLEASPLARGIRKGERTLRRPFQAIAKRFVRKMFNPAPKSQYNVKYINLSEELREKQNPINYPSTSTSDPISPAEHKTRDKNNKDLKLFTQDINGIWGPGVNLEKDKNPKSSLTRFVLKKFLSSRTKPSTNIKKQKASSSPPLAVPVEPEVDSYLKALHESRIPCQPLEDPDDCDDFSQLFKPLWSYNYDTSTLLQNQGLSPTAIQNEYLVNFIDPSQIKSVHPSIDSSNDFLLQKPILFLSPNIKFTIYHHSSPTIDSSNDEIALPSFDMVVEADSSVDSETPSLDSLTETSGLNVVGPFTAMKLARISPNNHTEKT